MESGKSVEMIDSMPTSFAIAGAETRSGTKGTDCPLRFFTKPVRTLEEGGEGGGRGFVSGTWKMSKRMCYYVMGVGR